MKLRFSQLVILFFMIGFAGLGAGRVTVFDGFWYGVMNFFLLSIVPLLYLGLIWEKQTKGKNNMQNSKFTED